jgi:Domain of unknown function (DUF6265)
MSIWFAARLSASRAAAALVFSALIGLQNKPVPPAAVPPANPTPSSETSRVGTLAELAWLDGRWRGSWGPRTAEQSWTSPEASLMLGDFRVTEDDKTLLIELFTLAQKPDGIELRFRHFTPELVPWEKSGATLLRLEMSDSKRFVFVNRASGQPKRSILTEVDPDTYTLRSEIVPANGSMEVVEITFHRELPASGKAAKHHH